MHRRLFLIACLSLFFVACGPRSAPSPTPPATLPPAVTAVSTLPAFTPVENTSIPELETPTLEPPDPTESMALEPTLAETTEPAPTPLPQQTGAVTAIPQPSANSGAIQIYSPGPQSKIVSPVILYGYAIPGYKHKGRVELYGEDGRLITAEILQLNTVYKWAYFYWPLPFSLASAGELGRLTMSTVDQYGRTTAVNSIHLLLLSEGRDIVYPPGELDLMERCLIETPEPGKKPSGGILTVRGKFLPFNNLPLTISLIGRDGVLLNSQLVPITQNGANLVPFQAEIPYSLQKGANELLSVSQFDDRISGMMYLYSQEIFLNP